MLGDALLQSVSIHNNDRSGLIQRGLVCALEALLLSFLSSVDAIFLAIRQLPGCHGDGRLFVKMIIVVVQIINDSSDIFVKQIGTQLGITHAYLGIQPGQ